MAMHTSHFEYTVPPIPIDNPKQRNFLLVYKTVSVDLPTNAQNHSMLNIAMAHVHTLLGLLLYVMFYVNNVFVSSTL